MNELTHSTKTDLATLSDELVSVLSKSKASSTIRALESDALAFGEWAEPRGLIPAIPVELVDEPGLDRAERVLRRRKRAWAIMDSAVPMEPTVLAEWLSQTGMAGLKASTLTRRASSISTLHRMAGLPSPTSSELVRDTLKGLRNTLGVRPDRKAPLLREEIERMVEGISETKRSGEEEIADLRGLRDRALLLVGFAGGFRRSELVSLELRDLAFAPEGVLVLIRRSKTDQEGAGIERPIHYANPERPHLCPVTALRRWVEQIPGEAPRRQEDDRRKLFPSITKGGRVREAMTPQSVALIVKERAAAVGISKEIGAHSLRSGMATQAAKDGFSDRQIMKQGKWKSHEVMVGYTDHAKAFDDTARVL